MNHGEFNIAEMFSNSSNGKTSISKVLGTYLCVIGSLAFIFTVAVIRDSAALNAILLSSSGVMTLGSSMILGKILKPTKQNESEVSKDI
jgi:hypothetical protein